MRIEIGIVINTNTPKHPFVTILPTFWFRPLLVNGIPIFLETLDFTPEIPLNFFQENPPLFIVSIFIF
jgi:hypothetical protein